MNRSWLATCSSASGWAAGAAIGLTNDEQTFLDAGLAGREARQAAEEARLARELETAQQLAETEKARAEAESWRAEEQSRSAQRLRWLAVGLTIVLLFAVGAAWLAIDQG